MWPYLSSDGDLTYPTSHLEIPLLHIEGHLLLRLYETTLPSDLLLLSVYTDLFSYLFSSLDSLSSGCQGFSG